MVCSDALEMVLVVSFMSITMRVPCVVLGRVTVQGQQATGRASCLLNKERRAIIQPPLVTCHHVFKLPAALATTLSTSMGWQCAGQDRLIAGTSHSGSSDADDSAVTLVTNNVVRKMFERPAGAMQGFVGINGALPPCRLHRIHSFDSLTAGFNSNQPNQSTCATGPVGANAIMLSLHSTVDSSIACYIGGGIPRAAVGDLVAVNTTASTGRLHDVAGGVAGMLASGNGAFREQSSGIRAEIVGTNTAINRGAGVYVTAPTCCGSALQSFSGIRIDDVALFSGQVAGNGPHAFCYNDPDDVVIDASGFVGIGMVAPDVSLGVDGGFVMQNVGAFDIDAPGTSVVVGNRSCVIIRNPHCGARPNSAVITLGDGVRNGHVLFIHQSGGANIIINEAGSIGSNANRTYNNNVGMYVWYDNVWSKIPFSSNP